MAAGRQLPDFVETAAHDHQQRARGGPQEQFGLPKWNKVGNPRGCRMDFGKDASPERKESPGDGIDPNADDVNRSDDARQRHQKQQNDFPALCPRQFLPFKEIDRHCWKKPLPLRSLAGFARPSSFHEPLLL